MTPPRHTDDVFCGGVDLVNGSAGSVAGSTVARRLTVAAAFVTVVAIAAGITAALAAHQMSATTTVTTQSGSTSSTPVSRPAPAVSALDDDHDDDDDDDDDDGWGWPGHRPDDDRGSDLRRPSDAQPDRPGATRERIEQRNRDQVERDQINNRRIPGVAEPTAPPGAAGLRPEAQHDSPPPVGVVVPPPLLPAAPLPPLVRPPDPAGTAATQVPQPAVDKQALESTDAMTMDQIALPDAFRAGYPSHLRSADTVELAVLALPGVAGMLTLTVAGGVIGYRQAKAGRALLAAGSARFL